jgi:hypothetical protein
MNSQKSWDVSDKLSSWLGLRFSRKSQSQCNDKEGCGQEHSC